MEKNSYKLNVRINRFLNDHLPPTVGRNGQRDGRRSKTVKRILRDYYTTVRRPGFLRELPEPISIIVSTKDSEGRFGDHITLAKLTEQLKALDKKKLHVCLPDEAEGARNRGGTIVYLGGPVSNDQTRHFFANIKQFCSNFEQIVMKRNARNCEVFIKPARGSEINEHTKRDLNSVLDFGFVLWGRDKANMRHLVLAGAHSLGTFFSADSLMDGLKFGRIAAQLGSEDDSFACLWQVRIVACGLVEPELHTWWTPLQEPLKSVEHLQTRSSRVQTPRERRRDR